ncbi:Phosphodiesterase/alkaline phosphatase D [Planctomycetales bacterium 10988]|nr:Phosphodiesterase/alkaline phosphatase D [Planctomycetales bacterium 10988]
MRSWFITSAVFCFLVTSFCWLTTVGELTSSYDLVSSEFTLTFQPEKLQKKTETQYKRIHQDWLRMILNDKTDKVVKEIDQYLESYPKDAETYFMLTLANSKLGKLEEAYKAMQSALNAGLPAGRFLSGPRNLLEPLFSLPEFLEFREKYLKTPVHGPMLGCISGSRVQVWLRTVDEADVVVWASESEDLKDPIISTLGRSLPEADYTTVIPLTGLKPGKTYYYGVLINPEPEEKPKKIHQFKTLHDEGTSLKFRLAFGGGAGYVPEHERMWKTIQAEKPDCLLLLGDNVYIDDPESPQMQNYCYYRRQSRSEFRDLVEDVPVFSIWDDHDFGTNDCSGGPKVDDPPWKLDVWQVFCKNWTNPAYGQGTEQPGCYYQFYLGDVHFIMLDGRYYRNHNKKDSAKSTMLGPDQKAWLKEVMSQSEGTIKVLVSPVPWVFEAKGDSPDTWNGFKEERKEIFSWIKEMNLSGVVLLSADRHRSDLWKIDQNESYPLYEMNSSRLTNQHVHPEMKQAVFSYNKKQSFGTIDFDTKGENPSIHYRIVSIDGEEVFQQKILLEDLQ